MIECKPFTTANVLLRQWFTILRLTPRVVAVGFQDIAAAWSQAG